MRISNPYGERQRPRALQGAAAVFLYKALMGEEIEIWGDGSVTRDYLHIRDVARAVLLLTDYTGSNKLFNIGGGHGYSLLDLVRIIEAEVLSNLDFLVIPSRWHENSPLVLLNSLASHTPVIVSDGKGMTEFIEEGRNGYIFPMGSVAGLERVLRKIIDNPESSRDMSKTTEYPWTNEMMIKEVLSVYESVL